MNTYINYCIARYAGFSNRLVISSCGYASESDARDLAEAMSEAFPGSLYKVFQLVELLPPTNN